MPLRDGTGPLGLGLGSGRRRGGCYSGSGYRSISHSAFRERKGLLLSIAVPLVVAVLRDLFNQSGVLSRIAHAVSNKRVTENNRKI